MSLSVIFPAVKTLLEGEPALTALLATRSAGYGGGPAIYDEGTAPSAAPDPYVTIGAGTQVPFDTFSTAGWNCTIQIKAVGRVDEIQLLGVLAVIAVLCYRGRQLTVPGYTSVWCDEFQIFPTLITTIAGVPTRECPAVLRIYAT